MLRIAVVESSSEAVRLRMEVRLIGRRLEELRRTRDLEALSDEIRLTLDRADVSFAIHWKMSDGRGNEKRSKVDWSSYHKLKRNDF
jgi:hypothetical protein